MGLHEVSHDFCELDLVLQRRDLVLRPWQQRGQAVDVVCVNFRYVGIRNDDEWQVLQRLYAVRKSCRQDRERKVG